MEPALAPSATAAGERALGALLLAGRALDPNAGPIFRDRRVAAELLGSALRSGLIALGSGAGASIDEALAAVDPAVLRGAGHDCASATACALRLDAIVAGREPVGDLREEERFVARIVERAGGTKRDARRMHTRRWLGVGLAVATVAAILAARLVALNRGDFNHFVASSASGGFPKTGLVGERAAWNVFFHTVNESNPWVEIDLGRERDISQVKINNRVDCCSDRAVPLIVAIRPSSGPLQEVARRTAPFDEWTASFPEQRARFVRLTVAKKSIFHLHSVTIQ